MRPSGSRRANQTRRPVQGAEEGRLYGQVKDESEREDAHSPGEEKTSAAESVADIVPGELAEEPASPISQHHRPPFAAAALARSRTGGDDSNDHNVGHTEHRQRGGLGGRFGTAANEESGRQRPA